MLDLAQIRLARIVFQYPHRPASQKNIALSREMLVMSKQPVVSFAYDPKAVEVEVEEPGESEFFGSILVN